MEIVKFKVVDKSTGELIGYEELKDGEWQHYTPGLESDFVSFGVFQGRKVNRQYERKRFTGQLDKDGKAIYVGDKVKLIPKIEPTDFITGVVIWVPELSLFEIEVHYHEEPHTVTLYSKQDNFKRNIYREIIQD